MQGESTYPLSQVRTNNDDKQMTSEFLFDCSEGLMWVLDGEKEGRMRLLWLKSDAELENMEDV